MESIHDPKNIIGVAALMDDDDINSQLNLEDLEKEVITGANIDSNYDQIDHAEEYKKEMERIQQRIQIPGEAKSFVADEFDFGAKSVVSVREFETPKPMVAPSIRPESMNSRILFDIPSYEDKQMNYMTSEEKKRGHIDNVMSGIGEKDIEMLEKEREEDDKDRLLERIDSLRDTLQDDGIDISKVPVVDKSDSYSKIQTVYKSLRLKNDRNRYCSFAEEVIMAGAYGLEGLFDGEKVWFGSYRPNLVGWSSTVKVKLRRMRYETSTFVGEIMENYQMSAGMRLCLELIPSLFLYSRQKKIAGNDNLASDKDYKDAISQLNSL